MLCTIIKHIAAKGLVGKFVGAAADVQVDVERPSKPLLQAWYIRNLAAELTYVLWY